MALFLPQPGCTGPGIKREKWRRLLSPFFPGDPPVTVFFLVSATSGSASTEVSVPQGATLPPGAIAVSHEMAQCHRFMAVNR